MKSFSFSCACWIIGYPSHSHFHMLDNNLYIISYYTVVVLFTLSPSSCCYLLNSCELLLSALTSSLQPTEIRHHASRQANAATADKRFMATRINRK